LVRRPKIILIGGGGHCHSVIDVIEAENKYDIVGILDNSLEKGMYVLKYKVLGGDELISKYASKENLFFLITVGQIKSTDIRRKIAKHLSEFNAKAATVISPRAYLSNYAEIKNGTVVHHDVIINAGVKIGFHCILNTKALIEHDSIVQDFCHISTGAIVNGDCFIESDCFLGSNSTISNGCTVKSKSIISANYFLKS